jgi:uncharacterized protein (TIRG00374 family)
MVLPSKMGDVAKSVFMTRHGLRPALALALVVVEKSWDMLSLLAWCVLGLTQLRHEGVLFWVLGLCVAAGLGGGVLLIGSRSFSSWLGSMVTAVSPRSFRSKLEPMEQSWEEMRQFIWQERRRLAVVCALSLLLWFLHLVQIWMFTLALRQQVPFVANLGLAPLAILAGLLPLTFAGIGTRDAAIILFYQRYLDPAAGAALGLLCTSRYLLPAIAGLPYFRRHLNDVWTSNPGIQRS